ncbi:MAG TPA: HAD family hydrolase [Chthonomonadales bacterium]|nr:HAD family hydrolase [Chthonomonadales bacterium]
MPLPRCILWDIDGTLIDTTELISESLEFVYQTLYHRTMRPEERRALIGIPLKRQIRAFGEPEKFGVSEEQVTAAFIRYYEAHRSRERIFQPVIELLARGSKLGISTGLVTSKNDAEIANTLPRLGIVSYVQAVVSADAVTRPKPYPDGIIAALSLLGVEDKASTFYVGDTVHDMEAARAAGIRSIGVTWGAAGRRRLEAAAPDHLCDSAEELARVLNLGG